MDGAAASPNPDLNVFDIDFCGRSLSPWTLRTLRGSRADVASSSTTRGGAGERNAVRREWLPPRSDNSFAGEQRQGATLAAFARNLGRNGAQAGQDGYDGPPGALPRCSAEARRRTERPVDAATVVVEGTATAGGCFPENTL